MLIWAPQVREQWIQMTGALREQWIQMTGALSEDYRPYRLYHTG